MVYHCCDGLFLCAGAAYDLMKEFFLGKLDAQALPHEWFTIAATVSFFVLALLTI